MELSQTRIRVNLETAYKVLLQKSHKHLPAIQTGIKPSLRWATQNTVTQ